MINEKFTTSPSQFGFPRRVRIMKVMGQVKFDSRGLQHVAAFDLEKAHDKLNRETIINVSEQSLNVDLLSSERKACTPAREKK